jgi:hypothetical protein
MIKSLENDFEEEIRLYYEYLKWGAQPMPPTITDFLGRNYVNTISELPDEKLKELYCLLNYYPVV